MWKWSWNQHPCVVEYIVHDQCLWRATIPFRVVRDAERDDSTGVRLAHLFFYGRVQRSDSRVYCDVSSLFSQTKYSFPDSEFGFRRTVEHLNKELEKLIGIST
jgi:hypothetical protein